MSKNIFNNTNETLFYNEFIIFLNVLSTSVYVYYNVFTQS